MTFDKKKIAQKMHDLCHSKELDAFERGQGQQVGWSTYEPIKEWLEKIKKGEGDRFSMEWDRGTDPDEDCIDHDSIVYQVEFLVAQIRPEGVLLAGIPYDKSECYVNWDYEVYAEIPFAFIPNNNPIEYVEHQTGTFWRSPCHWTRKLYSEKDLLLWWSMVGRPLDKLGDYWKHKSGSDYSAYFDEDL